MTDSVFFNYHGIVVISAFYCLRDPVLSWYAFHVSKGWTHRRTTWKIVFAPKNAAISWRVRVVLQFSRNDSAVLALSMVCLGSI